MATWTIYRGGNFKANLVENDNRCGKVGQTDFSYEVEIDCRQLDNKNFIVDNFRIPDQFNYFSKGLFDASCEQLVGGAVMLLFKLAGGNVQNPTAQSGRATRIKVKVKPLTTDTEYAGAAYEWNAGEALPNALPKRVDVKAKALPAPVAKPATAVRALPAIASNRNWNPQHPANTRRPFAVSSRGY